MSDWLSSFWNLLLVFFAWVIHQSGLPVEPITALGWLLLLDYVTGVGKSIAIGVPVESRTGWIGVLSKLGILAIPLAVALMAKSAQVDASSFVAYSIILLSLNEGYSVIANSYAIRHKKELPEWSVIELMLGKIQSIAEEIVRK